MRITTRPLTTCMAMCAVIFLVAGNGIGAGALTRATAGKEISHEQLGNLDDESVLAQAVSLPNPCSLLTDEEIDDVLRPLNNTYNVTARKLVPFPDIGGGQCDIEIKNSDGFTSTFSISVSPEAKGTLFIEPGTRKPIPGMGEEAFEVRSNYYATAKGVLLHVVDVPGNPQQGAATLLRAAMAKL